VWNDRRLARRAARGDKDAFAAIFRRYEQDLYRYCVAIVGDRQDAQDALQNTMVKALRALPGERREIELKPWLYRVAHNESIELRRRARPSEPLADDLDAPVASLEETAAGRVRLRDLLADIAELSERHRGALVMRELGGLDFDEIGTALDTTPGAARQVLYEARRSLQQMSDGREMRCDAVTELLSDGDGRVARRRDVRAHLRDCSECRGFAEGIRGRSETLAGIAPLPALAAVAIAKGALAGSAGGGAAGAGSAGGTGAAAGGAAGLAGGAAKVASTGAILKSTAAIVAVLGAGAVAVDHSHLLHGGGSSAGKASRAAAAGASEPDGPSTDRTPHTLSASPAPASRHFRPTAVEEAGPQPPKGRGEQVSVARPRADAADPTPATATATVQKPGASVPGAAEGRATAGQPARAAAPPPPADAAPPADPPHPAPGAPATPPAHPPHPQHPSHPPHPAHPAHPAHPDVGPQDESQPEPEAASPPEADSTPKPPGHSGPKDGAPEDEAGEDEATAPETADPPPQPTPPAEPPGQAKK
jgi:RNA polymerase sigma factor (sigma-70 family)